MKWFLPCVLALIGVTVSWGEDNQFSHPTVRVEKSAFRLIREVNFQGRNLFDLAIEAGMYKRSGNEYLPGAELGAVSVGGQTWHGSNGVGLVAYDPHMERYRIYYLQDIAVPGHHLQIVYSDDEFIFFSYGAHRDLPTINPAMQVYSIKHDFFVRIESVSSLGGRFGYSDMAALASRKPGHIGPSMGWDHRHFSEMAWISLTGERLCHPERITLEEDIFTVWYHTSWEIDEFVTTIQFNKSELQQKIENQISNKTNPNDGK